MGNQFDRVQGRLGSLWSFFGAAVLSFPEKNTGQVCSVENLRFGGLEAMTEPSIEHVHHHEVAKDGDGAGVSHGAGGAARVRPSVQSAHVHAAP